MFFFLKVNYHSFSFHLTRRERRLDAFPNVIRHAMTNCAFSVALPAIPNFVVDENTVDQVFIQDERCWP